MRDWTIENLTPKNIWAVAELQESHYGKVDDTSHAAYLEYLYFQNPAGPVLGYLAWNAAKREAVGGYSLTCVPLKIGTHVESCVLSGNSLTRASHRGQGVYSTLINQAYRHAAENGRLMVYGMPNQNSYPVHLRQGLFQDLGAVPLYLRPLRPSGMVRSYLKSNVLAALARPFDGLFYPRNSPELSFVKLTNDNLNLADQFWDSIKDKYPIMVARDSSRLAWRFLNIPRRKYECWYAMANGAPVAFVIGREMEVAGIRCAMLADLLFLKGHELEAKSLIRKVLNLLREQGADMAGCMMLSHCAEQLLLRQLGFFRCPKFMEPQPFPLCIHQFREPLESVNVADLKNWFFTMGDYDVV